MSEELNNKCPTGDDIIKQSKEVYEGLLSKFPFTNKSIEEIESMICFKINEKMKEGFNFFNFSLNARIKEEDISVLKKSFADRNIAFEYSSIINNSAVISVKVFPIGNTGALNRVAIALEL